MSYCGDPYELQPTLFTYKMKEEKQLASVQIIMIQKYCESPVRGAAKIIFLLLKYPGKLLDGQKGHRGDT